MKAPRRPKPMPLDTHYVARVIRGPNSDGDFYWGVLLKGDVDKRIFSMWGSPAAVAAEFQRRKDQGDLLSPKPHGTMRDLTEIWYQSKLNNPSLAKNTKILCDKHKNIINSFIGDLKPEDFNQQQQDAFRNSILGRYSQRLFNEIVISMRTILRIGMDRGYNIPPYLTRKIVNPAYALEKYTPSKTQLDLIYDNLKPIPWILFSFNLLRETGLRCGELHSLTWDNIDFDRNQLLVYGKTKERVIPISQRLQALLLEWRGFGIPERHGNILGVGPGTISINLNRHIKMACDKTNINHRITVHSIRRYFVSRLRKGNVPLKVASSILGHGVETLLKIYSEIDEEELHAAVSDLPE